MSTEKKAMSEVKVAHRPLKAHYEVGRVAALLDMSVRWVKERVKAGDLEGFRLGNRIVISADSLEDFMQNRRM